LEAERLLSAEGGASDLVSKISAIYLTRADFKTCKPRAWLNDNILNAVLKLMEQEDPANRFFHAHLVAVMMQLDNPDPNRRHQFCYEALPTVRRARRRDDIFACRKLFFPVTCRANSKDHHGPRHRNHWALVVVDMEAISIQYYDSLGDDGELWLGGVEKFLQSEWRMLKPNNGNMPSFTHIKGSKATPQQSTTSNDCGVFMLATIDLLRHDISVTFSQDDITNSRYRLRIVAMLIHKTTMLEGEATRRGPRQQNPQGSMEGEGAVIAEEVARKQGADNS